MKLYGRLPLKRQNSCFVEDKAQQKHDIRKASIGKIRFKAFEARLYGPLAVLWKLYVVLTFRPWREQLPTAIPSRSRWFYKTLSLLYYLKNAASKERVPFGAAATGMGALKCSVQEHSVLRKCTSVALYCSRICADASSERSVELSLTDDWIKELWTSSGDMYIQNLFFIHFHLFQYADSIGYASWKTSPLISI